MALSNYLRNKLLDHSLATSSFTMPAGLFIKLHTADPGVNCTTAPANNTTRVAAAASAAASGATSNSGAVSWTSVSTAETYTHFSSWDAVAAGNPLHYGALSTPRAVLVGDNASFAIGALAFTAT